MPTKHDVLFPGTSQVHQHPSPPYRPEVVNVPPGKQVVYVYVFIRTILSAFAI